MKIDEINRNPSYLVAGILLALISLVLVGSALAIWGRINYPNESADKGFIGYPFQTGWNNPALECLEDDSIEFVAQDGCDVASFDTEQGTIEIVEQDSVLPTELPLCLTQDVLDNYYVTVKVFGGYEPLNGSSLCGSYITLTQKNEYVGKIYVEWTLVGHDDCSPCGHYYDYWKATFVLPNDTPIELDSNKWPAGADPVCEDCIGADDTIPDKEVYVSYYTLWCGCCQRCQRFELIQTQKKIVLRTTPTSHEIIISSPV
jgi:hypothetical protein